MIGRRKKKAADQLRVVSNFPDINFGTVGASLSGQTIVYPSGTTSGDLLFLLVQTNAQNTGISISDWANLGGYSTNSAGSAGGTAIIVYQRIAGAEANVTLADYGDHALAVVMRVRPNADDVGAAVGFESSGVASAIVGSAISTATTAWAGGTVTATKDKSIALLILAHANDSATTTATFSGGPALNLFNQSTATGNGGGIVVGAAAVDPAGTTGALSYTGPSSKYAYAKFSVYAEFP